MPHLEGLEPLAPVQVATYSSAPANSATGWHYDCESQQAAVEAATASMLGGNAFYANYIFSHESCEDPGRLNSIGAKGLGQAYLHADFTCGPNDITCQINWFTGYANSTYGGWGGAYSYWLGHQLW